MIRQKIFGAFIVLFLLTSCGGSSSQKENNSEADDSKDSGGESPEMNDGARESVASILDGMWHLEEYFKVIEETKSVHKASGETRSVFSAGFEKEVLMEDSPMMYGGSAHEGGFGADLEWDAENEVFRTSSEGRNSIAPEPFQIEILSDTMMKLVPEGGASDLVFRKTTEDNGVEQIINGILFAGTYKLSGGETLTFTRDGKITGYADLPDMDYEVMEDFFEYDFDVLIVSAEDGTSQYFHYVFDDNGFTLFDIYGDEPGAFTKGDLVNEFVEIGSSRSATANAVDDDIEIKSNYFDLPGEYRDELKNILNTDNLSVIENSGLEKMKDYLDRTVLGGRSQFGINLESNYFWYVYNALPDFVSKDERHNGYYRGQNEQEMSEKLMAYAMYRLDRSPENIERLYRYARPVIKRMLPGERKGIPQKVQRLLGSYEYVTDIDNYKEKLSDAYMAADTMTGSFIDRGGHKEFRKFENSAYGFSVYDLNEHVMKHLKPDVDRFHSMPADLSFWMRRNHEGNMEVVHSILQEIQEMM